MFNTSPINLMGRRRGDFHLGRQRWRRVVVLGDGCVLHPAHCRCAQSGKRHRKTTRQIARFPRGRAALLFAHWLHARTQRRFFVRPCVRNDACAMNVQ